MTLENEIRKSRQEIVSDGYEMSVGEIINLYRDKEIVINPEFQRLFRWDQLRKTRFIESLLLGIPVPPVFVYQDDTGVWELIDGLQRLSTIFEFVGILRQSDGRRAEPSVLVGTNFLPSLADKRWDAQEGRGDDSIGQTQQLEIKRARLRVEILKHPSDPKAKYELFQRLNTGGAPLSEQEVRNCVAVMLNKAFYNWLVECARNPDFRSTIDQTEKALTKQSDTELALRFFVFRNVEYKSGLDVHEYLDSALLELATSEEFDLASEKRTFDRTFKLLNAAMGSRVFKRWDGGNFLGKFLMSVFEVVATGVSYNISEIEALSESKQFVEARCKKLWSDPTFDANSGAGIRGTTRLTKLLPMAREFFKP
ncbi:MAG: hypothetical protein DHS20C16_18610 [Phycisphaerae bacterium]|nr:MAG: hypothetical protein DHS20C16_18610 [Phycisphaerae bacterium]